MATYTKLFLLFAVSAALVGLSSSRQIQLANTNGCKESGLLVRGNMSSTPPASFKGGCDGKIDVGAVSEAPNGANQAVAFTVGRQLLEKHAADPRSQDRDVVLPLLGREAELKSNR